YLERATEALGHDPYLTEWVRLLFHAGSSSPNVLLNLVQARLQVTDVPSQPRDPSLLSPASPYDESRRIRALLASLPRFDDEPEALERVRIFAERWQEEQSALLAEVKVWRFPEMRTNRLVEVARAVHEILR